jgi:predicted Zn-dependent protease with MMP-like domain
MKGILQQPAPKPKSNPMLDQIVQQAEAQVPEELKSQFLTIMTVGGKMMWSEEMTKEREEFDQIMQQSGGDVPQVVTHTVLKIISIIQNESQQEKPLEAVGLAAPIFMAHILQYVESKHGVPVTKEMIDETGQMLQVNLLKLYGVTEQHLQDLIKQRGSNAQGQPAQFATEGNTPGGAPEAQA